VYAKKKSDVILSFLEFHGERLKRIMYWHLLWKKLKST